MKKITLTLLSPLLLCTNYHAYYQEVADSMTHPTFEFKILPDAFQQGHITEPLGLISGHSPGVYLVIMQGTDGERVVRRMVKN